MPKLRTTARMAVKATSTTDPRKEQQHDSNLKRGSNKVEPPTSTTNSPEDNDLAFYDSSSPLPFAPLDDKVGYSDTGSTSNTNRREDNDANNNDANRTSRNGSDDGSDDERSAEVEDNENNSTTEEEYDNHNNFNNAFLPSLLSCLLLHQNHRGESSDYNSFLSSSVNMRKYLNVEKLLPDITDETRNKSLVSRTMEANDMTTPLDGRYNVVLVSYDELGEEEKSAAVLYPTYSGAPLSEENGSKYKAIPQVLKHC